MKLLQTQVDLKCRYDPFLIVCVSDIHKGAAGFDQRKLSEVCSDLKQYDIPIVPFLGGDLIDGVSHGDPRFDAESLDPMTKMEDLRRLHYKQAIDVAEILQGIPWRGVMWGNHEQNVSKRHGYNPAEHISEILKSPFSDYALQMSVRIHDEKKVGRGVGRGVVIVGAHHGYGGGRKKGGKVNKVEDMTGFFADNTDMIFFGHVHEKMAWVNDTFRISNKVRMLNVPRQKAFALTGCYLKTWVEGQSTYGERAGYPMANLGSVGFECRLKCVTLGGKRGHRYQVDTPTFKPIHF